MQEDKLRQHDLELYNSVNRIRSKFGRIEEVELIEQVIALLGYKYLSNNTSTSKDIGYELDDSLQYENLLINKGTVIETLQKGIAQITKNNNNIQSSDVFYDLFDFIDFNTFNENNMWLSLIDAVEKLCSETTATIGEIIIFLNKYPSSKLKLHHQPTKDIIKLVTTNQREIKNIYDPFVDTGTLLAEIGNVISVENYYGQHPNKEKCARAKMTLLTNGVNYKNIFIKCNDITEPILWNVKFDLCITIPPFGRKDKLLYADDLRFQPYSPKRASEQAYLLDMLYHLDENGTIKMIVPDGVLRRGGPEKIIIKYLVENELISTIIGLPEGIFKTTAIATTLLILNKTPNKDIYYLNLRNAKTRRLSKTSAIKIEDIDKYIEILSNHEEMELTSKIATIKDIKENDYNLAINRYVDSEKLEEIDIEQTITNIKAIKMELKQVDEELNAKIGGLLK